jgi:hypothetical protein
MSATASPTKWRTNCAGTPVEGGAGDHLGHHLEQGAGHHLTLGTGLEAALGDAVGQRPALGEVGGQELLAHAHHVADDVPGVHVRVDLGAAEVDVEAGEAVEHRRREGAQRPGEVLLVDRQVEGRVPARVLADQVADRRVHQADLLRRAQAGAARRRVEPAGAHDVDDHLRRLDDAALRVAVQPLAAGQHLHALAPRVAQRQRVRVQQQDHQRAEALEHVDAESQARRVGPRGQRAGLEVVAHVLRQRPRRQVVVLDQVAHQIVDRLHHRRPAGEQLGDHGVRGRVAGLPHGVEERIGPEGLRHQ